MTNHTGHNHPMTSAGRAACRKAARELLEKFDGVMYQYLEAACHRFCRDQHDTYTRDDLGNSIRTIHHAGRIDCAHALVQAGLTFADICHAYS